MTRDENAPRGAGEQEAVRTTIVGGRPPGSGKALGDIPRGIEVLVKKAAVDPAFRALLLEARAGAAREIGLELDPVEAAILGAVPASQLEAIISNTKVNPRARRAFLGKAAAVMIAALGVGSARCDWGPVTDMDGDGIPDSWEVEHFGSTDLCDPADDSESDGLTNLEEYQHWTDPLNPDTDGDTHSDGAEVASGSDPLDPESPPATFGLSADRPPRARGRRRPQR